MPGSTDFVPFATGVGANVTAQAAYIAESTTTGGFQSGEASSADCNKVWRQGTFVAAGVANFIAGELSVNVADDGNLTVFVANLTAAIGSVVNSAIAGFGFATVAFVNANFATIVNASNASNLTTGTLAAARLPASFAVGGTITAAAFNVSSDWWLKKDIQPIEGALGRLDLWRGVTFRWKTGGDPVAGIIAQEFRAARPEGVREVNGRLVVDPMSVIAELRQALGEERDARRALEARVALLEPR